MEPNVTKRIPVQSLFEKAKREYETMPVVERAVNNPLINLRRELDAKLIELTEFKENWLYNKDHIVDTIDAVLKLETYMDRYKMLDMTVKSSLAFNGQDLREIRGKVAYAVKDTLSNNPLLEATIRKCLATQGVNLM